MFDYFWLKGDVKKSEENCSYCFSIIVFQDFDPDVFSVVLLVELVRVQ